MARASDRSTFVDGGAGGGAALDGSIAGARGMSDSVGAGADVFAADADASASAVAAGFSVVAALGETTGAGSADAAASGAAPRPGAFFEVRALRRGAGAAAGSSSCGAVTVCWAKYRDAPKYPATKAADVTIMVTTTTPNTLVRSLLIFADPCTASSRVTARQMPVLVSASRCLNRRGRRVGYKSVASAASRSASVAV